MPRFKLTIAYDGTDFSGWQIQPDARTVEGELEAAFSKICQQDIELVGQGRTDAGVHAHAQIAHMDLETGLDPDKLIFGVNGMVSPEIYIQSIEEVHEEFHARFDAGWRSYSYTIMKQPDPLTHRTSWVLPRNTDTDKLEEVAQLLAGEHDFAGFSKYNEENYTTLCEILESRWEEKEDRWIYRVKANRFLRNMVRRLVGTMMRVAEGKLTAEEFDLMLKDPGHSQPTYTAPARGLILEEVFYPKKP